MFDNVIVGVEEYQRGRDAIALAKRLMSDRARSGLVYVEVLQAEPSPEADTAPDDERQRAGLKRLRDLRDTTGISAEVSRLQAPSVRAGLHDFAERRGADLIVIGAGGRNPVTRPLLGDQTREVLDGAPCPVAVAPAGYAGRRTGIETVGVAYDGSPESGQALALARGIDADCGATLSAFKAVHTPAYAGDIWNVEGEIDEDIEAARRQIASLGGVEPHAQLADDSVTGIRRYAASVDLLVLGSHTYRGPEHLLERSKAQRLADEPSSPLLVLSSARPRSPTAPAPFSHRK